MNRLFHGEPVPEKQIHPVGNSGVLPRLRTSTWNFNYFSLTVKGGAGRGDPSASQPPRRHLPCKADSPLRGSA